MKPERKQNRFLNVNAQRPHYDRLHFRLGVRPRERLNVRLRSGCRVLLPFESDCRNHDEILNWYDYNLLQVAK